MTPDQLINLAAAVARPFRPAPSFSAGTVGCALLTASGKAFTGVCLDGACGIGFCAEHAAIAEMVKQHESAIAMVVAVDVDGCVLPPCGRCRELMMQVDPSNRQTAVILGATETVPLEDLLPRHWLGPSHRPS